MTLTFNMAVFLFWIILRRLPMSLKGKNGRDTVSFCLYSPYRCKKGGNAGFFKG